MFTKVREWFNDIYEEPTPVQVISEPVNTIVQVMQDRPETFECFRYKVEDREGNRDIHVSVVRDTQTDFIFYRTRYSTAPNSGFRYNCKHNLPWCYVDTGYREIVDACEELQKTLTEKRYAKERQKVIDMFR